MADPDFSTSFGPYDGNGSGYSLGAYDPNDFSTGGSTWMEPDYTAQSAGTAGNSGAGTGAAVGAGLGLLQAIAQQSAYQAKMKQLETTTRFSPWTHMSMAQPGVPNSLGDIAGLAAAGAMQGQALSGGSLTPLAISQGNAKYQINPNGG